MGIKGIVKKAAGKAGNAVAKLSSLSPEQLEEIEGKRAAYLAEMPSGNDPMAVELTSRLIAAAGIEIYSAYLPQISRVYVPVEADAEYAGPFDPASNIRFLNITKWVVDSEENSLEKLVNVYDVVSTEHCNIALVFHRMRHSTEVFLAVVNTANADHNVDITSYIRRIEGALRGNFPGSEWTDGPSAGQIPCLKNLEDMSVATVSNVPTEKSEKFISQTIEKLLDGIVPRTQQEEYTLILLATPTLDAEERKLRLEQLYTGLAPYSSWQTNFTYQESKAVGSSATVGVNAGMSIGRQAGTNQSLSTGDSASESENRGIMDSENESHQESSSISNAHSEGSSDSVSDTDSINAGVYGGGSKSVTVGASAEVPGTGIGAHAENSSSVNYGAHLDTGHSHSKTHGTNEADTLTRSASESIGRSTGRAVSNTLGRAVTRSLTNTVGGFVSTNLGGNFGVNFARSSSVTATIGKNEGITQTYTNYSIKHALELLEKQMARCEQGTALGLWDFAAYVLSEDVATASNVAHTYLALTQGEESFMSQASVNVWRGDLSDDQSAETICDYLKDLRHPIFGLNPGIVEAAANVLPYPATVTATTALTGKELARSLSFPRKAIAGLPVFECASFGRNVSTFDEREATDGIKLGSTFHMHRAEPMQVPLDKDSLAAHVFITGSTGAGKSNAVYRILGELEKKDVGFLVVEPAKGEYKDVFGTHEDVRVYGTNPDYAPLLKLDPFSFPKGMHVLEHLDRLVEIFNVCWPMYAAMPAVLKNAIERSYEDCGWELATSRNLYGEGLYPTFADVARNVRVIIDSSEYDAENKGAYKGSLLTRLSSLSSGINGMVFSSKEISPCDLFDGKTIVDLSRVGSSETKSLLMGILVLKLQEHRMAQDIQHNAGLRHVTVLEEAHNLLKRTSTEQPVEGGNLLGKSVEMLSNAIAEMRTYGEGFIIVDQAPGLLDASVIRNTNTKIVLRLPDAGDRELVGGAEALTESQVTELARLPRGVAAVFQNDWIEAVLCKVDRFDAPAEGYRYHPAPEKDQHRSSQAITVIAKILLSCEKVTDPKRLAMIDVMLCELGLSASARVSVTRMLRNPTDEPRMANLGSIIGELFPDIRRQVAIAHRNSPFEPKDWTAAAMNAFMHEVGESVDTQLRRDIIQAVITDYLVNELNDMQALNDWTNRGRLA